MLSIASRNRSAVNVWPGYVDALASVLMVFIFMLLIFVVAQFFLADVANNRFGSIQQLSGSIHALLSELSVEKDRRTALEQEVGTLSDQLGQVRASRERLAADLDDARSEANASREALNRRLLELESVRRDIEALRTVRDELESRVSALVEADQAREAALGSLRDRSMNLEARLADEAERTRLAQVEIGEREVRIQELSQRIEQRDASLVDERTRNSDSKRQIENLNDQLGELNERLARLSAALEISEQQRERFKVEVDQLGEKLNLALAERVETLSRFRSDFFGRLREVLGDRSDVQIKGDRFVFQSEVLFASGSAELEPGGQNEIDRLAETLKTVAERIPGDLDWILRVDGHTDRRPIRTSQFPSNWELSTARALSIVRRLIEAGIPPRRLAATGFGEFRPLDPRSTEVAFARNRRIELKITGP